MKYTPFFIFMLLLAACKPSNGTIVSLGSPDSFKHNWYRKDFVSDEKSDSVPFRKKTVQINSSYEEEVKNFTVKENHYKVDLSHETKIIAGNRGTVIKIPKNSLIDKNGNPYSGEANISFKEYTNSAEIAFSNIPMTYRSGKDELRFNGAGMFEINATSSTGDPLYVGKDKSISIDYKLVKKNPGTDFYRLDKKKNSWIKVSPISRPQNWNWPEGTDTFFIWGSGYKYRMDYYTIGPLRKDKEQKDTVTQQWQYVDTTFNQWDLTNGLAVNRFGIYNCDQVYRLANKVTVNAKYVDEVSGEPIADLYTLSLIDLSYIGAFQYSPYQFSCDSQARNVLLAFTMKGNLYYMDEERFQSLQLADGGTYTLRMKNITSKVKSTEDLEKLLKL